MVAMAASLSWWYSCGWLPKHVVDQEQRSTHCMGRVWLNAGVMAAGSSGPPVVAPFCTYWVYGVGPGSGLGQQEGRTGLG